MIAIDPGVSGGIAYQDTNGAVHALPMPGTLGDMVTQLRILAPGAQTCCIEELPRFGGKMSAAAMGTMFQNYGRMEGILATLGVRVVHLKPKEWQKILALGSKADHGDGWKRHLKGKAQALFPHLEVTLKTADALLILEAGRRLLK